MSDFRDPFAAARWELVPGRTVLVLIDLQNDFLHPDGWYAQHGIDISHMRRVSEATHGTGRTGCRLSRRVETSHFRGPPEPATVAGCRFRAQTRSRCRPEARLPCPSRRAV